MAGAQKRLRGWSAGHCARCPHAPWPAKPLSSQMVLTPALLQASSGQIFKELTPVKDGLRLPSTAAPIGVCRRASNRPPSEARALPPGVARSRQQGDSDLGARADSELTQHERGPIDGDLKV